MHVTVLVGDKEVPIPPPALVLRLEGRSLSGKLFDLCLVVLDHLIVALGANTAVTIEIPLLCSIHLTAHLPCTQVEITLIPVRQDGIDLHWRHGGDIQGHLRRERATPRAAPSPTRMVPRTEPF